MNHNSNLIHGTLSCQNVETITPEQSKLIKANHDLVKILAWKLIKRCNDSSRVMFDDLVSAGDDALIKAAQSYDPCRGAKFRTYASHCIKHKMLAEIKSKYSLKVSSIQFGTTSVQEFEDSFVEDVLEEVDYGYLHCNWEQEYNMLIERLYCALDRLEVEERELIYNRYGFNGEPMKLRELAEYAQKSPQAIAKRINNILDKLREFILDDGYSYRLCA